MRSLLIVALLHILSASAQDPQAIYCEFQNLLILPEDILYYSCYVVDANITHASAPLQFFGAHLGNKTNEDVTNIRSENPSNNLALIHPQLFTEFPNLESLILRNANVRVLEFENCEKLTNVFLYNNPSVDIPNGAFSACNNLKNLTFLLNHNMTFHEDSLSETSLEFLFLYSNENVYVTSSLLRDLTNLRGFYMSNSGSIEADALSHLRNLEQVEFYGYSLESYYIEQLLNGLTNLTYINIGGNELQTFNVNYFNQFEKLEVLFLNANKLTAIPVGAFERLTALKYLTLGQNQLTSLDHDTFRGLSNLTTLLLHSNAISDLDSLPFAHLTSMATVDISQNPIESLPPQLFASNQNPYFINFHGCNISDLQSDVFKSLPNLFQLSLSNNRLTKLPADAFVDLPSLVYLQLYGNQIKRLNADSFGVLQRVFQLDMRDNQVDEIEPNFFANFPRNGFYFTASGNECVNETVLELNQIDFENENVLSTCFYNWQFGRTTTIATSTVPTTTEAVKPTVPECPDEGMGFWTKFTIITLSVVAGVAVAASVALFIVNRHRQGSVLKTVS